jgi:hypothetical protein
MKSKIGSPHHRPGSYQITSPNTQGVSERPSAAIALTTLHDPPLLIPPIDRADLQHGFCPYTGDEGKAHTKPAKP